MNSSPVNAKSKSIRFIILLAVVLAGMITLQLINSSGSNQPSGSTGNEASDRGVDFDAQNSGGSFVRLSMVRKSAAEAEPVELAPPIRVPWQAGQTLLEATRLAGKKSPKWQSKWHGEAEMALLTELGGFANEGATGLNWQFDLNDKYGEKGAGQTELDAGDHALWQLAPYE